MGTYIMILRNFFQLLLIFSFLTYAQTYYRAIIFYDDINDIKKYLEHSEIDVVHDYTRYTKHVDVYLSSSYFSTLENEGLNIVLTAKTVDESHKSYILGPRWEKAYGYYPKYHHFDSLLQLYEEKYPDLIENGILPGKSVYGRDIFYLKLSNSPYRDNKKPAICVLGVIHSDEPIGAGIVRDGIEYLCEKYTQDPEIKWLVDNRQIYFIPVLNVDRYIWNENQKSSRNRKRKTLDYKNGNSGNSEAQGGVDPNRNFPYKWGFDDQGSSPNPTAMNYRGKLPADQKCVQACIQFFKKHTFRFWNVYHSSGEKVIVPFGHTRSKKLSAYDSTAYHSVYHEWRKFYPAFDGCGPAWKYYFPINGSTEDWAWYSDDTTSKVYGYITELGPGTGGGYWFSDDKSRDMCQRMLQCDIVMAKASGFYPILEKTRIKDPVAMGGNNNGILNPSEKVELYAKIFNRSVVDTTKVQASLSSPSNLVEINDGKAEYGKITQVQTVENTADPFVFTCHKNATPGTKIPLEIKFSWEMNTVKFEKVLCCTLRVGEITGLKKKPTTGNHPIISITTPRNQKPVRFQLSVPNNLFSSEERFLNLSMHTISGREIMRKNCELSQSQEIITWDLNTNTKQIIPNGIYFLKVQIPGYENIVQKVEIIR